MQVCVDIINLDGYSPLEGSIVCWSERDIQCLSVRILKYHAEMTKYTFCSYATFAAALEDCETRGSDKKPC